MTPLIRYMVFTAPSRREPLCICAARDKKHALKIARQLFALPRTAYAVEET
jgi:hypothetical protein